MVRGSGSDKTKMPVDPEFETPAWGWGRQRRDVARGLFSVTRLNLYSLAQVPTGKHTDEPAAEGRHRKLKQAHVDWLLPVEVLDRIVRYNFHGSITSGWVLSTSSYPVMWAGGTGIDRMNGNHCCGPR